MPEACGYTWPLDLDAIIREESAAHSVPLDLAYTFIAVESGFNPRAHNTTPPEDSVGLLQLNRIGGQGAGYSVEQLMDPRFNLRVGLPYIAAAHQQTRAEAPAPFEFVYQVAIRSGHPGLVDRMDPRILRIFTVWVCFHTGVAAATPEGYPWWVYTPSPTDWLVAVVTAIIILSPAAAVAIGGSAAFSTFLSVAASWILRSLKLNLVVRLGPRTIVRRQLRALSPAGLRHKFVTAIDPRHAMMARMKVPFHLAPLRVPPRHRWPRY